MLYNTYILAIDAITGDIEDSIKELEYTTLYRHKEYQLMRAMGTMLEASRAIQEYIKLDEADEFSIG